MTLYDLFHPLVEYMVACRHGAATGKSPDREVMYSHIMREFAVIRKTGAASAALRDGLDDACTYTAFYIDYMVHEGGFPFAREWQDLGRSQYNELAGDEKFFDYMERWLGENTPLAKDHLRLMHAMVGSGFSGVLERRSVRLEALLRRAAEHLALQPEAEAAAALFKPAEAAAAPLRQSCPQALGLVLVLLALLVLGVAAGFYVHTYTQATEPLRQVLTGTREHILTEAQHQAYHVETVITGAADAAPAAETATTTEEP